jgi:hypothetical protein
MKTTNPKTNKAETLDVHVTGKYKSFEDFLDKNKPLIYGGVVDSFKQLLSTRKREIKFVVNASLLLDKNDVMDWKTEFQLSKKEPEILIEHIMPYFEDIEDYEKCSEILNLYKSLTKNKK